MPRALKPARFVGLACLLVTIGCAGGQTVTASPTGTVAPTATTPAAPEANAATPTATLPTPSRSAALPELDATYTSASYGYSVGYPQGWTAVDGRAPWPAHTILFHNDPHLDVVRGVLSGDNEGRFTGASRAVTPGTTPEQFLEDQGQSPSDWSQPAVQPLPDPVTVDGLPAFADLNGAHSLAELGGLIWDVVLVTPGGRGYNFTIDGFLSAEDVARWLNTIRLTPETAHDAK